ncbi:hypothetical protein POX_c04507 [Penicillium oxalicum]|uniref:hypothetical protein n=1 Tax=Penicillium oxalicum TaxID=69781 RepID=UPI0020B6CD3D|nr:hypothetical protein POX_c04507 [Penicillium oxalicum]KAI2791641.1 hypothetical protein POX_c04507 [Penicillium oxalicum]
MRLYVYAYQSSTSYHVIPTHTQHARPSGLLTYEHELRIVVGLSMKARGDEISARYTLLIAYIQMMAP